MEAVREKAVQDAFHLCAAPHAGRGLVVLRICCIAAKRHLATACIAQNGGLLLSITSAAQLELHSSCTSRM